MLHPLLRFQQDASMATSKYCVPTIGCAILGAAQIFICVSGVVRVNGNAPYRYKQGLTSFFCVTLSLGTAFTTVVGAGVG
ncbi:hypothetical protein NXY56_007251 [Leishmania guyanensis]|uniref:Uncharacterized protein n=1 Tax=Leishmania guyanensis TaxID=5670 RepID=A0A1E1J5U5_LEIGU|nr:Hypothetical protein BN36_3464460 [Leishmania guyanensis]